MRHDHCGTVTVIHKLDPNQFAAIAKLFQSLIEVLGSSIDPAEINAVTDRLRNSEKALESVVDQTPQP